MIDQAFEKVAGQIYYVLLPGLKEVFSDLIRVSFPPNLTPDEFRITSIKYYLEIMTVLVLILILTKIRKSRKKKKRAAAAPSTGKPFKPKRWKTDGSYYDEEKNEWIRPDYK